MTDTVNVPRELLERWKKSLNKIALQSAFHIADELSAILAQPAADCGLEVVAWRIGLQNGAVYAVYGQHQPWAYERYGTPPYVIYEVQDLIRKSDADARDAMRLERIAELEAELHEANKNYSVASAFCPTIYKCAHCLHPVVSGYCCTKCGSANPRSKPNE